MPWNLQPLNYEVATTATSHSRRTTDNVQMQKQLQYNFQSLEGTKPSTSSATAKPGNGYQYSTLDGMAHQSNLTRSKEDDMFSNLTVSYNKALSGQTPTHTHKRRVLVSPLGNAGYVDLNGRSTAQHMAANGNLVKEPPILHTTETIHSSQT